MKTNVDDSGLKGGMKMPNALECTPEQHRVKLQQKFMYELTFNECISMYFGFLMIFGGYFRQVYPRDFNYYFYF